MSKTNSHQFSGTRGEKIAQGIKPESQRTKLIDWANDVLSVLDPKSNTQRKKFNTATVAFDEATGDLYFGRNGGIDKFGDEIHPDLKNLLPSSSQNDYPTPWNCSESDAINRALHGGAKLHNLHIYTIYTSEKGFGNAKVSCKNCTMTYKGKIKKNNTGWHKGE